MKTWLNVGRVNLSLSGHAEVSQGHVEGLLESITSALDADIVGSHIQGSELWVRVKRDAWCDTAKWLKNDAGFTFFNFLSAIDWMQSPFGRDMDSQVDKATRVTTETSQVGNLDNHDNLDSDVALDTGVTAGDTRFQMLARLNNLQTHSSVFVKADVPDDDLTVRSWVDVYPGANWHEREVWEMFGIDFDGHPQLKHLYLPSEFEGHPLRKDYPLLARRIKPWPGIVDVELMPESVTA